MTGRDPSSKSRECGSDVAAYALDALEDTEAEAFRRHLEACIVCRDELTSFQQVVDILSTSVSEHRAPKALRRRVLAEVGRDAARAVGARRLGSWRLPPSSAARRPAVGVGGHRPSLALGTLLAAVVIAVGSTQLGSSGPARTEIFRAQVVGSSGSAEVRLTDGHADLVVHHLAPPPAGQIYEVWLARSDRKPQPTGALFSVTARGEGDIDVPGNLHGVQQVIVTTEPAGGSRAPTHPAVIAADLT